MREPVVVCVFGVSGVGKTTIGSMLSRRLGIPFIDADDYHPEANIRKMAAGTPLSDSDRLPWLLTLHELLISGLKGGGAVIACSALKEQYREILGAQIEDQCKWILLEGTAEVIGRRMASRSGHFMPAQLLDSQLQTLEIPEYAMRISIDFTPDEIVNRIVSAMGLKQLGIIGMGVMGRSLAMNFARNGYALALYNRRVPGKEERVAQNLVENHKALHDALGFEDLVAWVNILERPRKVLLMIEAGSAVDEILGQLLPLLSAGDVVSDCGNSHYQDTERRVRQCAEYGVYFLGTGISGGEEGALNGPAIMSGGSREGYVILGPAFERIAAKDHNGLPCCAWFGPEGAGHFVKMVHNGIEYAEMQLIAEVYGILRHGHGHSPDLIAGVFDTWARGIHAGYLMEISAQVLQRREGDHWLIDRISDVARSKGTGAWTVQAADRLGFPAPVIAAAVHARYLSGQSRSTRPGRTTAVQERSDPDALGYALYLARLVNHHLGFELLRAASDVHGWDLDLRKVARVWTNGCIIRSDLMQKASEILPAGFLEHALPDSEAERLQLTLSYLLILGADVRVSLPCHSAALQYFNELYQHRPTANLIQAQRDYFGAHGYQRTDDPAGAFVHTDWKAPSD